MNEADQWKLLALAWMILYADSARREKDWIAISREQSEIIESWRQWHQLAKEASAELMEAVDRQQERLAWLEKENQALHAELMERLK